MTIRQDLEAIFADNRKNADRVNAIMELMNSEFTNFAIPTGVGGALASEETLAGGVTIERNGNGDVIYVRVELDPIE